MTEAEVRGQLVNYLADRISLRELDEALAAAAWNAQEAETVRELANAIALRLDEYSSGACSQGELREVLRPIVTEYSIHVLIGAEPAAATPQIQTSVSSSYVPSSPICATPTAVDRRPAAAL